MKAMTDPIGMELRYGLENAFRSICFTGMYGFLYKMSVGQLIGLPMVYRRVSIFLPCQIKSNKRKSEAVPDPDQPPDQFP